MKTLPKQVSGHPELIAIGLEITLDPKRRQLYSPLILQLADVAMQELMAQIAAIPRPPRDDA
jgi:hypothetical protein